jgi:NADPH-dependent curcumin reductase CurA
VTWCQSAGRYARQALARSYIVSDYYPKRLLAIRAQIGALLREKRLHAVVSEFDGLDRAPEALATVFERGSPYIGRRVVRISKD